MKTYLEKELDKVLNSNLSGNKTSKPNNALVIGHTGTGRTSIIKKWAKENNINLVEIHNHFAENVYEISNNMLVKSINPNGEVRKEYYPDAFKRLEKERSVLLLSYFNSFGHTSHERSFYYSILKERKYFTNQGFLQPDITKSDGDLQEVDLPNLLFTIAEVRPLKNKDVLPESERELFDTSIYVKCDKKEFLDYLISYYDDMIHHEKDLDLKNKIESEKSLACKILTSDKFHFDDSDELLNYIRLKGLLSVSAGNEQELLNIIESYISEKSQNMFFDILKK